MLKVKFVEGFGVHLAASSLEHAAVLGTKASKHTIRTINGEVHLSPFRKAFDCTAKFYQRKQQLNVHQTGELLKCFG